MTKFNFDTDHFRTLLKLTQSTAFFLPLENYLLEVNASGKIRAYISDLKKSGLVKELISTKVRISIKQMERLVQILRLYDPKNSIISSLLKKKFFSGLDTVEQIKVVHMANHLIKVYEKKLIATEPERVYHELASVFGDDKASFEVYLNWYLWYLARVSFRDAYKMAGYRLEKSTVSKIAMNKRYFTVLFSAIMVHNREWLITNAPNYEEKLSPDQLEIITALA